MAAIHNLPALHDPIFVGRQAALSDIRNALASVGTCVIQGPGGVGKTRLALEYARQTAADYSAVWFLRCDQPAALQAGLMKLAEHLGLDVENTSPATLRNDLRRTLAREDDWLLILDGAASASDVREVLPNKRTGRVVVTAAGGNWAGFAPAVHLDPLTRAESVDLLQRRTGRHGEADADRLAKALGDLPLALDLAAALVREGHLSFAAYLRRFEDLWVELLQAGHQASNHPSAVAMAWELSFRQLADAEPVAADLLTLSAFLSPDDVRLSLLRDGARFAPHPLAPAIANPAALAQLAATLARYALAEVTDQSVALRRDTASLARARMDDDRRRLWARVALRLASDAFEYRPHDLASHRKAAAVLPHLLAAAGHIHALEVDPVGASKAFDDAGQFLYERGRYAEARDVLQRALDVAHSAFGSGHPRLAAISNNFARALARAGEIDKAREHYEAAIQIDAGVYGYANPRVATLVNNYGRYHYTKGDFDTARQQFEWARGVFESHYGPEHQRVAAVINNIGYTHGSSGQLADARAHLERALEMAEKTYPDGHPDVARICANLGRIAQAQGDRVLARAMLEKALLVDRNAHGHEHPDVARDLVYLGDFHLSAQDPAAAGRSYEQALLTAESVHGPYHPAVVSVLQKLGAAREAAGDTDGARWCLDRAGAIRRLRPGETGVFAATDTDDPAVIG